MNEQERIQNMPIRDKSVPYGNDEAILQAMQQDGYCVVTGILSPSQVQEMMNELWKNK